MSQNCFFCILRCSDPCRIHKEKKKEKKNVYIYIYIFIFIEVYIGVLYVCACMYANISHEQGKRITLEHSQKHHFGTQPFWHSFGTQNATSHQTTPNKPHISLQTSASLWKPRAFQTMPLPKKKPMRNVVLRSAIHMRRNFANHLRRNYSPAFCRSLATKCL